MEVVVHIPGQYLVSSFVASCISSIALKASTTVLHVGCAVMASHFFSIASFAPPVFCGLSFAITFRSNSSTPSFKPSLDHSVVFTWSVSSSSVGGSVNEEISRARYATAMVVGNQVTAIQIQTRLVNKACACN